MNGESYGQGKTHRTRDLRDPRPRAADRVLHRFARARRSPRARRTASSWPPRSASSRSSSTRASASAAPSSPSRSRRTPTSASSRASLARTGSRASCATTRVPGIGAVLAFEDNKGTTVELFKDWSYLGKHTQVSGVGPLKLGHVAWVVNDVQATVDFYTRVLGFRVSDWIGDFFAFIRCNAGPPHAEFHPRQEREDAPHGVRAEGRGAPAIRVRPASASASIRSCGDRCATAPATTWRSTTAIPTTR